MEKLFDPHMTKNEVNAMSALALAHIGDGVFELLVRTRLCLLGGTTNSRLHRQTVSVVKATKQAEFAEKLQPLLREDELGYYKRGRNAHAHGVPKSVTPVQYAKATGLEALFGALYLLGQKERLQELFAALWEEENAL